MIVIEHLRKAFGNQVVLDGVDLTIHEGEMLAIVGPSGAGKSVMLRIITGLLDPDGGSVTVDGDSITDCESSAKRFSICRRMGVLFQGAALLDSITLYENVAFPLRYRGGTKEADIRDRVLQCIDDVGLIGYENLLPGEVSIGMRKRIGIARALVTNPKFILFDEPNTGLDPQVGQEIYELIGESHRRLKFTGIVISHEIPEVFQVCSRVVMLYKGLIQVDCTPDEFLGCDVPVVQQFVRGEVEGPLVLNY